MTFQVTNKNCSTENLKVDCNHTLTIPNFEDWLTEKAAQMPLWLFYGETFSPVSGCFFQLQILVIRPDNVKVYLKNCGNDKVKMKSCTWFVIVSNEHSRKVAYSKRIQTKFEFQQDFLFAPITLRYEFKFSWSGKNEWTPVEGEGVPKKALIIECKFSITLSQDFMEACHLIEEGSLLSDMKKLFSNPNFSDWTLICEGEKISCHRNILGARSLDFQTMFEQTGFKESSLCQTQITDIQLITLKALVKYIYTDALDPENDNIKELFVAADKYDIQGLKKRCESILAAELKVENAAEFYILSYLHGGTLLKEKSTHIIAKISSLSRSLQIGLSLRIIQAWALPLSKLWTT